MEKYWPLWLNVGRKNLFIKALKMFQINRQKDCYAQVGQGIPHPCTKLEIQNNLTAIVKSTSPTMQGKVLSSSIKDLSTNESGNTLALKTFCPKQLAASVGKNEVKKPFFFLDKLNKLQLKLHAR